MYFSLNQWEIGDTLRFYYLTKIMQLLSDEEFKPRSSQLHRLHIIPTSSNDPRFVLLTAVT